MTDQFTPSSCRRISPSSDKGQGWRLVRTVRDPKGGEYCHDPIAASYESQLGVTIDKHLDRIRGRDAHRDEYGMCASIAGRLPVDALVGPLVAILEIDEAAHFAHESGYHVAVVAESPVRLDDATGLVVLWKCWSDGERATRRLARFHQELSGLERKVIVKEVDAKPVERIVAPKHLADVLKALPVAVVEGLDID